jgi:hypothetical protein
VAERVAEFDLFITDGVTLTLGMERFPRFFETSNTLVSDLFTTWEEFAEYPVRLSSYAPAIFPVMSHKTEHGLDEGPMLPQIISGFGIAKPVVPLYFKEAFTVPHGKVFDWHVICALSVVDSPVFIGFLLRLGGLIRITGLSDTVSVVWLVLSVTWRLSESAVTYRLYNPVTLLVAVQLTKHACPLFMPIHDGGLCGVVGFMVRLPGV